MQINIRFNFALYKFGQLWFFNNTAYEVQIILIIFNRYYIDII